MTSMVPKFDLTPTPAVHILKEALTYSRSAEKSLTDMYDHDNDDEQV